MAPLRAAIVIDYQNVHLTAHGLFAETKYRPRHECLIDPLHFSNQAIQARNRNQKPGMDHATLQRVLVYRGQPSPEHDSAAYARNQAQKAQWERDPRVAVHLRPLKYDYLRDVDGRVITDGNGEKQVVGKREKGVDVLCALAVMREARRTDVDVVILASQDSDLEPALDEAIALHVAKIETCCWFDRTQPRRSGEIRPSSQRIWNTRLDATAFRNSWDMTNY